jgi:uncharacterized protein YdiU (UPF0061 family)
MERCTVITRIAETFLRFGSFEIFRGVDPHTGRGGPSAGNVELLRRLLDYCVDSYFAHVKADAADRSEQYVGESRVWRQRGKRPTAVRARQRVRMTWPAA